MTSFRKVFFKSIDYERNVRINSRITQGKGELKDFRIWLENFPNKKITELGIITLNKINSFEYSHNILNKNTYLAHVSRVTKYSLLFRPQLAKELLVLGLIHNIFEATEYDYQDLLNYFDNKTLLKVKILKVDRKRQHMENYLFEYYKKIEETHISVSIIKILDKIDNIFTLCLNPSVEKRMVYLKQIEDYVVPLTKRNLPEISDYLIKLINNAYEIGYMPYGAAKC